MADFECEFDFVVVGSGGGESVLILEKTDKAGGSTARSGGAMWIPNNRFMKRDGIEDGNEATITYLEAISEGLEAVSGATPARRRAYVENGAPTVDFLAERGIPLTRVARRITMTRSPADRLRARLGER